MIVSIHQPQYLPWLGYFAKIAQADVFVLLDDVQFKKNEWQNRNYIKTPQGRQWLTVPVLHDFGQRINAVRINNDVPWAQKHKKALELNYRRAPYFDRYFPDLVEVYHRHWERLVDVNVYLVRWAADCLGLETRIVMASDYETPDDPTDRLVALCRHLNGDTYLAGAGGQHYMDIPRFEQSGIELTFQQYDHPVYPQVSNGGFLSHLSIVDLLMNNGPRSAEILQQQRTAI